MTHNIDGGTMTFSRLRYHIVTATKGRKPLITERIEATIYEAMRARAEALGSTVCAIGGVDDHIHLLAAIPPHMSVSSTVGKLKGWSSRQVHELFPSHDDFAWQVGFSAFTVSPGDVPRVASYVRNQKIRHELGELWEKWERPG